MMAVFISKSYRMTTTIAFFVLVATFLIGASMADYKCQINRQLYLKHLGLQGVDDVEAPSANDKAVMEKKYYKKCIQPGCFFITPQENLGWSKWVASISNKGADDEKSSPEDAKTLMGCRYDIPYLVQRTYGSSDRKLHKMLKMLRACFVGEEMPNPLTFCQPEFNITLEVTAVHNDSSSTTTTTTVAAPNADGNSPGLNGLVLASTMQTEVPFQNGIQGDDQTDKSSWLGRHAQSVRQMCFYNFVHGVFFVRSGKHHLVVCCTDGEEKHGGVNGTQSWKDQCKAVTEHINEKTWRKD